MLIPATIPAPAAGARALPARTGHPHGGAGSAVAGPKGHVRAFGNHDPRAAV